MTQWYVKDLSKLTGVSVQTLHHYDRIDLLKPSVRMANGYRVYSEKDLLKLQQIIALKFFDFELSQIKTLLKNEAEAIEHFSKQAMFLEEKAKTLLEASRALKSVISDVGDNQSIPWKTIIKLIEVYRMTQKLEHPWVKEIFTTEELKEYTDFKSRLTPEQKASFEKRWFHLIDEVKNNLDRDPKSEIGVDLGRKFMAHVNDMYGKKYAHLRTKKFEKGFGEGKGLPGTGLTPEILAWLEKSVDAYWRQRIYATLAQVGKISSSELLNLWNEILDEMHGEDSARKAEILHLALENDQISQEAKKWLQSLPKG